MLSHTLRASILFTFLCLSTFSAAQTIVAKELDLNTLGNVPAVVEVSPNFLTIIEFEGMSVESATSGRPDQLVVDPFDNIVTIRAATPETVNTDLFVRVGGRTALFKLVSAPDAENPRRYIVRDKKPFDRDLQGNSLPGGLAKPDNDDIPPPPPGLEFKVSAYRPSPEAVVVQYVIVNSTEHPFVNDPQRLRIYQDNVTKYYERDGSPVPGRPGRLSVGDSEPGQIVIPGVPANASSLELEWTLVEVGPGTVYRKTVDLLAALGEKMPDSSNFTAPPTPSEPPSDDVSVDEASPTEVESSADDEPPTEPSAEDEVNNSEDAPTPSFSSTVTPELQSAAIGEELTFSVQVTTDMGSLEGGTFNFEVFNSDDESVEQQFLSDLTFAEGDTLTQTLTWTPQEAGIYTARVGIFRDGWNETLHWNDRASTVTVADSSAEADAESAEASPERAESAAESPTESAALIREDFEGGAVGTWDIHGQPAGTEAARAFENGEACIDVTASGEEYWSIGLTRTGFPLEEGQTYLLRFDAHADKPINFRPAVTLDGEPWTEFFGRMETLDTQTKVFSHEFEMVQSTQRNRLIFFVGANEDTPFRACFDDVELLQENGSASAVPTTDRDVAAGDVQGEADRDVQVLSERTESAAELSNGAILVREDFEGEGAESVWDVYEQTGARAERVFADGEACTDVTVGGEKDWNVGFYKKSSESTGFSLKQGQTYLFRFDAYADEPVNFRPAITLNEAPWTNFAGRVEALSTQKRTFAYEFEMTQGSENNRIVFFVGGSENAPYRVCFDNVELIQSGAQPGEEVGEDAGASADANDASEDDMGTDDADAGDAALESAEVVSSTFDNDGDPEGWWRYATEGSGADAEYITEGGATCLDVAQGGEELWNVGLGYSRVFLDAGEPYRLSFDVYSDEPVDVRAAVSLDEAPYTEHFGQTVAASAQAQSYGYTFGAPPNDQASRIVFFMGGRSGPYRVCFDNIGLTTEDGQPSGLGEEADLVAQTSSGEAQTLGAALLVVGEGGPNEVDPLFRTRLEQLGWRVDTISDTSVIGTDLTAVDLIVVSPSVVSNTIDTSLRDVALPIVTSEEKLFAPLGMTGDAESVYFGESQGSADIQLVSDDHPLSAGLSGTVRVSDVPHGLAWGAPSPNAIVVATVPGDETKAAIFAYEMDAPMIGMTAPERRVGLFHDYAAAYSDDAWALFDAAIRWAARAE